MIFYFSKISKSIDPFQSFTTFNGKSVSSLKKLSFNKLYVESFKQVFTLRKNIYIFVVVCYSLVEQIPLSTMVHTLHDIFLPVHDLIRLFFWKYGTWNGLYGQATKVENTYSKSFYHKYMPWSYTPSISQQLFCTKDKPWHWKLSTLHLLLMKELAVPIFIFDRIYRDNDHHFDI